MWFVTPVWETVLGEKEVEREWVSGGEGKAREKQYSFIFVETGQCMKKC